MTTALNINQFGLVPIRGKVDYSIARRGVMSVRVSDNEAGTIKPGDYVKLDPAGTGALPLVIKAANSDPKGFFVIFDGSKGSYVAGDMIEVTGHFGPVVWVEAEATIAMGATVENVVANDTVQTLAAQKPVGIALLNGVAGDLFPMMVIAPTLAAS
jgi:hypothetical protein